MARKGYRVATVEEELYRRALEFTGARSLSEALRRLLPECVQGYGLGGHVVVEAVIEEVVVDNVFYVGVAGLEFRLHEVAEILAELFVAKPLLGFVASLAALRKIADGTFKVLSKPERVRVNRVGYFLVDTGASTTVLNAALLPQEARKAVWSAGKTAEAQTATGRVRVSEGVAKITLAGTSVEERVLIVDVPSSRHHLMGVGTLKRLFGGRVLIDFNDARVCSVLKG